MSDEKKLTKEQIHNLIVNFILSALFGGILATVSPPSSLVTWVLIILFLARGVVYDPLTR